MATDPNSPFSVNVDDMGVIPQKNPFSVDVSSILDNAPKSILPMMTEDEIKFMEEKSQTTEILVNDKIADVNVHFQKEMNKIQKIRNNTVKKLTKKP